MIGLVAPTGASAQQTPPPAAASLPEGGVLNLTLDEAVERALQNNVDIAVSRYDPEISAQSVIAAQGYYDPFFFANLNTSEQYVSLRGTASELHVAMSEDEKPHRKDCQSP